MYKVTPYFLAVNSVALMSFWFYPIITTTCVFYGLGMPIHTARAFFDWMGALMLTAFCGSAFGMMWGCVLTDGITALMLNQLFVLLFSLGQGFMVNTSSSAKIVIKILSWISPLHYTTELLMYRLLDGKNEIIV